MIDPLGGWTDTGDVYMEGGTGSNCLERHHYRKTIHTTSCKCSRSLCVFFRSLKDAAAQTVTAARATSPTTFTATTRP